MRINRVKMIDLTHASVIYLKSWTTIMDKYEIKQSDIS